METVLHARPARYTRFVPIRRASSDPSSDAAIAVITCGRNIVPYWVLDRPYWLFSVKIVLAAGNVTSTTPWTRPATLTTPVSAFDATPSGCWEFTGWTGPDHPVP